MINITVDEAINGYFVSAYDWSNNKGFKEICERKIDALQIVSNFVKNECEKEALLITGGQFNESK